MTYFHRFKINGLPSLRNRHEHWATVSGDRKKWRRFVLMSVGLKPKKPLSLVRLVLERHSAYKCDYDNLVYSFKPVVDGLVEAGIIKDDDMDTVIDRVYRFVKVPRKEACIAIEIQEICPTTHTESAQGEHDADPGLKK